MTAPKGPAPAPSPAGQPRLGVRWGCGWDDFQEALQALRAPLPILPSPPAVTAFRQAILPRSWPGRALLLSVALHVLSLATPLPEFLTRPGPRQAALSLPRIEYDLRWPGNSPVLPPISPVRQPKRRASPGGEKHQLLPPPSADAAQRQTIISNPPQPNHPRQTLLRQHAFEQARVPVRDLRLPNIVIPPAPTLPPLTKLDLRRLRIPRAPLDPKGPTRAPMPPRPQGATDLPLAKTQLENLLPRLAVAPSTRGKNPTAAPDVEAPVGVPRSGDLTAPGLVALSPQPAPPTAVLELPESNLRARFATGPFAGRGSPGGVPGGTPRAAGGSGGGPGGEGGGPSGFEAPDILVTPAGPVPPGPVIVGPGGTGGPPGGPPAPVSSLSAPVRERVSTERTQAPPAQSPERRAEEILQGIGPGTRPGETGRGPRVYTIYINMPNLTSQSGSWVLRFAELGEESTTASGGAAEGFPLEAPVPMTKVDPGYPAAARRNGVEGSVYLYGVIRRDGTVENVRVVRSLEAQLDQSAVAAFQRWRFQPGRKNGSPVNLEVVVEIPFRLARLF